MGPAAQLLWCTSVDQITRRSLLAAAAVAVGATGACSESRNEPIVSPAVGGQRGDSPTTTAPSRTPGWVAVENQLPGSHDWAVPENDEATWNKIRGYATTTSSTAGDEIQLAISTQAPTFRIQAYRFGWYGGAGARLVWESGDLAGTSQDPQPELGPDTALRARWHVTHSITDTRSWPPGSYLLKLVSADAGMSYVPVCIRDDTSTASLAIMSSVTTWQAYNQWGGANLYEAQANAGLSRANVVSFDRPYYRKGCGEFFGREFEFVQYVERLGYDVTYLTSIDVHAHPERLLAHRAVISLGHDEYYSTAMRSGLEHARDSGVNLVFLGANAIFRKIRLEPSSGSDFRNMVNYRSATQDPLAATNPNEVTVSWRDPPSNQPESSLIGNFYEANPVDASLVISNPDSWLFDGVGLPAGTRLAHVVGNEYDRVTPERPTPDNIEVVCHSPVVCKGKRSFSDVTWYTTPSGAGVFASGTLNWVRGLASDSLELAPTPAQPDTVVQRVTKNLLDTVSKGPAGALHPSVNNLARYKIRPHYVNDPPQ